MRDLWTEKYRPKSIDEYVFRDERQRSQIQTWIDDKSIPHLLFSGKAGIGKTTLAKVLINELDIHPYDVLELNASRTNSVDHVRDTIVNFCNMIAFGSFRVVLLDEADYLSPNAQAALRGIMEEYHSIARFILTCNYPHRIIPALHSRCQGFHMENLDKDEYMARVATVLVNEEVDLDLETLEIYVKASYPDLRKCLNSVQANSGTGKLLPPDASDQSIEDWQLNMVMLFKEGKIQEARKMVCKSVQPDEIGDVFKWLYNNVDLISEDETTQEKAILIIKQGCVDHTVSADPEINLSATMIRIAHLF